MWQLLLCLVLASSEAAKAPLCDLCILAVHTLRGFPEAVQTRILEPAIVDVASLVCQRINASGRCDPSKHSGDPHFRPCEDLCYGMMKEEGGVLFELASDTTLSARQVCGAVEGACTKPDLVVPDMSLPPLKRSNLSNLTGEMNVPRWRDRTKRTRRFAHISDLHLQLDYVLGNEGDCGQPVCCRKEAGPARSSGTACGEFGYDGCDPPLSVLHLMLDHMASQDPDFILQTGDDPAHDVWHQSRKANLQAMGTVTAELAKRFPHVPVGNVFGNHGSFPVNQYRGPGGDEWLYGATSEAWSRWLPSDALETLRWGGFYQMRLLPKLRMVGLHSTLFAQGNNWFFTARPEDVPRQLAWVRDVLQQARARNEKVLWLMHHPSGSSYEAPVHQLMVEFSDIVVASFVGHAHDTWFSVAPQGPVEYCTGGDMASNLNPTYRIFEYEVDDDDNFVRITDFHQYYMDFATANLHPEHATFVRLYSAREAYGLKDLEAHSWRAMAMSWLGQSPESDKTWSRYANYISRLKTPGAAEHRLGRACSALNPYNTTARKECTHGLAEHFDLRNSHELAPRGLDLSAASAEASIMV